MSPITTHVLNTAKGRPASGVPVKLEFRADGEWATIGSSTTDEDGRARNLLPDAHQLAIGEYRITFNTAAISDFYPRVEITFAILNTAEHYHIPLLLSPFGYSTYRGS